MAVLGNQPVWTGCGVPTSTAENHELVSHASLSATTQHQNIALIVYHGASIVAKLRLGSKVYAHFDVAAFSDADVRVSEPKPTGQLRWIFARSGVSFLGLACDKLSYDASQEQRITSSSERCCWLCVAGNSGDEYTFEKFQRQCDECEVTCFNDDVCTITAPRKLLELGGASEQEETMQIVCAFDGSETKYVDEAMVSASVCQNIQNTSATEAEIKRQALSRGVRIGVKLDRGAEDEDVGGASNTENMDVEEDEGDQDIGDSGLFAMISQASSLI